MPEASSPSRRTHPVVDEVLAYDIADCSLGRVLAARSAAGLRAVLLGADDSALVADLAERFGRARVVRDAEGLSSDMARVIARIEDPTDAAPLALDVRGTVFQQRVWQALIETAPGQTVTYGELAEWIGAAGSARAVAGACAANPLAVLVPCHRVIAADGSLSGYRWGTERKRVLLARERVVRRP